MTARELTIKGARDALLEFYTASDRFTAEDDVDGRVYHITVDERILEQLVLAVGISQRFDESAREAIERAIVEETKHPWEQAEEAQIARAELADDIKKGR